MIVWIYFNYKVVINKFKYKRDFDLGIYNNVDKICASNCGYTDSVIKFFRFIINLICINLSLNLLGEISKFDLNFKIDNKVMRFL